MAYSASNCRRIAVPILLAAAAAFGGCNATAPKAAPPVLAMLALLSPTLPAQPAENDREREHLAAIVRQIDVLDRLARQSAAASPSQRSRYYFDYRRFDADIRRIRAGVTDYLNPPRAQPRDPAMLEGHYRRETDAEPVK